jgi:hypothetical protein
MNEWRFNRGHNARLALAGAIGGAFAVMAPAPALAKDFACTIGETVVWVGSRIQIRCDPGDTEGISYFALSATSPDSNRVLSVATTAMEGKLGVVIVYDPNDLNGAALGCPTSNCRLIEAIGLERQ